MVTVSAGVETGVASPVACSDDDGFMLVSATELREEIPLRVVSDAEE